MFVRWRKKPVKREGRALYLQDPEPGIDSAAPWKPLACDHRGHGRVVWTAEVVHSVRDAGRPRHVVFKYLPTIRSCCVADPFARAAWWHDVSATIRRWETERPDKDAATPQPRDFIRADKPKILAALREIVPPPTAAGLRAFEVFRAGKQAVHDVFWDPEREAREAKRREEEAREAERLRAEAEERRKEEERERWRQKCEDRWAAEKVAQERKEAELAQKKKDETKARAKARREKQKRKEARQKAAGEETDTQRKARLKRDREEQRARYERDREEARARREQERRDREGRERARQEQARDRGRGSGERPITPFEVFLGFDALGLPSTATVAQIKARYRDLVKLHHPDRHPDASPERMAELTKEMAEISAARDMAIGWAERWAA